MKRMHVTATELDQIIWYRKIEDMTTEELVSRLRHEEPPNIAMAQGTAFHSVLENATEGELLDEVDQDQFRFVFNCDTAIHVPQLAEIRGRNTYQIGDVTVALSGKCDAIDGTVVRDYKTSKNLDPEKFFGSYQWRAYLDIFDADTFEYRMFQLKQKQDKRSKADEVIRVEVVAADEFKLHRYPGMRDDLIEGLNDFVDFAKLHLPERFE